MELTKVPEAENESSETLARILGIAIRGRWWIVAAVCGTVIATNAVLSLLPNRYKSVATLLVVQQEIPERYVTPTTSTGIADALQAMTQEVLSRTRLETIIDEFHLYPKERRRLAPERVIDLMRRNIDIQPVNSEPEHKDFNAFKISYTSKSAPLAQKVTSRLTSLFIEANLKTREDQAKNTTTFLASQLSEVEKKLSVQEQRLRDFKMEHLGELPEQESGNLAILSGMQTQLQNTMANLSRAQQQQVYLQSLLHSYRDIASKGVVVAGPGGTTRMTTPLQNAQNDLARLQTELDTLLQTYTTQYPDVQKVQREIAGKKAEIARLKTMKAPVEAQQSATAPVITGASEQEDNTIAQLQSQVEANRLEIEGLTKDEKRLKASVAEYQARLNSTPVREQQLSEVVRDYDLLKKNYADLLGKQQQSQLAANLEKQQEGQHFQLLDPPNLPMAPSGPKRMQMSLGGLAGGLLLGIGLAFLKDMRSAAFHTERELTKRFGSGLVLGIPLLLTAREERKKRWLRCLEWAVACVLVLSVCASQLYIHRLGG